MERSMEETSLPLDLLAERFSAGYPKDLLHDGKPWTVERWTDGVGYDRRHHERAVCRVDACEYERSVEIGASMSPIAEWIRLIETSKGLPGRHADDGMRRAYRVLAMLGKLHEAGFQKLRLVPLMSANGMWLRLCFYAKADICSGNGAYPREGAEIFAIYSEGSDNEYFGWTDAKTDTAADLAAKFLCRFPELCLRGEGRDWEYAGWYSEMLGYAHEGAFPLAHPTARAADRSRFMILSDGSERLPLPPGGDAED